LIDDGGNKPKLSFLSDHPQFKTHKLSWIQQDYGYIPNFVGGMLPRRDKGDQDYYCCTMLVLFKPWQSANDLKAQDVSWVEAYELYSFSEQQ